MDGVNQGNAVPVSTALSLDTTTLTNGTHALTVIASNGQSGIVTSPSVVVTVTNSSASTSTPFVIGQSPVTLRNNYSGLVGFSVTVGSAPLAVTSLGRFVVQGNSGTHLLKLVNSDGTDVAGGSVSISLAGATAGSFTYASLPAPLTLQAGATYFLMSQETAGGDQWYDIAPVSTTSIAAFIAPVYTDPHGNYFPVKSLNGQTYVPLNFLYGSATSSALSVSITSPQSGASVSGGSVPVAVTTSSNVTDIQLQVDGVNQGASVSASPVTLNTLGVSNGSHTLTVVATAGSTSAVSAGVNVTVSNSTAAATALITGETASTLRNNYTGFVGTQIRVGPQALSVTALGRFVVPGNSAVHTLKLAAADGTDIPGASVSVNLTGAASGQFVYGSLAATITLAANTTYYLVSQETTDGDTWYDLEPVTSTGAAQILGATYTYGSGKYEVVSALPGYSYVPVSFRYQ